MHANSYDTLSQATDALKERGFDRNFVLENGVLIDTANQKKYGAKDLLIVEYHRFEGMSNPSDMSIVYALKTKDGSKGQLVADFSSRVGANDEFIQKIPMEDTPQA